LQTAGGNVSSSVTEERSRVFGPALIALLLASFMFRSVMNGVPPVLAEIKHDLSLTNVLTGFLGSLPLLCLAVGSLPGPTLVARFGARRLLGWCLGLMAVGAFVRLAPPVRVNLYLGMGLLSLGAAAAQPAASALVRQWFPNRVQRAATLQASGVTVGGMCGIAFTGAMALIMQWPLTFIVWSGLAVAVAVCWWLLTPGDVSEPARTSARFRTLALHRVSWLMIGIFAAQALVYNTVVTWLPIIFHSWPTARIGLLLTLVNVGTLLPAVAAAVLRPGVVSRRSYYIASGLVGAGSSLLLLSQPEIGIFIAPLLGASVGMAFVGSMALPALLTASPADVSAYAALMLTGGYLISTVGPLLGGLILDVSPSLSPLWPAVVASAAMVPLSFLLSGPPGRSRS
jgi:MFS transporter, CP family, cyanate transporter